MRFKRGREVVEIPVTEDMTLAGLFAELSGGFRVDKEGQRGTVAGIVLKGGIRVDAAGHGDPRLCRDVPGLVDARSAAVLVREDGPLGAVHLPLTRTGGLSMEEEDKRLEARLNPSGARDPTMRRPDTEWTFQELEVLPWAKTPPPSAALDLLRRVAYAPGVVALMQQRRWRVLRLTEMRPEGLVGVSPACLLGFNRGRGLEISLRLRTDDMRGFRTLQVINRTLYHELAHMEFDDHDDNFKELASEVAREAVRLDWTKGRGQRIVDYVQPEGRRPEADMDNNLDVETRALLEAPGGVGPSGVEAEPSSRQTPHRAFRARDHAPARHAADAALRRLEGVPPEKPRVVLPYNPAGRRQSPPPESSPQNDAHEGAVAVGVRLGDGSRITTSLPPTATVGDVRKAVDRHAPAQGARSRRYVLASLVPAPKNHSDDESLVDAGLVGALLVQRFVDE